MDKFVKKWQTDSNVAHPSQRSVENEAQTPIDSRAGLERVLVNSNARPHSTEETKVVDVSKLPAYPTKRKPISEYKTAKVRDDVRQAYLQKGPISTWT